MFSLQKVLNDIYFTCKQNPGKWNGSDLLKVTQWAVIRAKHNFLTPCDINPVHLFRNKFTFPTVDTLFFSLHIRSFILISLLTACHCGSSLLWQNWNSHGQNKWSELKSYASVFCCLSHSNQDSLAVSLTSVYKQLSSKSRITYLVSKNFKLFLFPTFSIAVFPL